MSGFFQTLIEFFFGSPPAKKTLKMKRSTTRASTHTTGRRMQAKRCSPVASVYGDSKHPKVQVLQPALSQAPKPYWQFRSWRQVRNGLYLGYFKTRLGRRHGVIKWQSQYDFAFYVHDVPAAILNGPKGACFVTVKPGKYRVHFAQVPTDVNSGIFYIETLLQEAFQK